MANMFFSKCKFSIVCKANLYFSLQNTSPESVPLALSWHIHVHVPVFSIGTADFLDLS